MLKKTAPALIISLVGVLPLFFWTLTPNFFSTPKEFLLSLVTLITLALFLFDTIKAKKLVFPNLKTAAPLLLFVLTLLISLILNPEGRPEALSGKTTSLLSLSIIALLLIPRITGSAFHSLFNQTLIATGSLLSLHSLLSLTFLAKSAFVPAYMQTLEFTPTGNYVTTLVFILLALTAAITSLKRSGAKPLLLITLALNTIAAVAIIALMLPQGALSPVLLSYSASWSIALDALKSLRSLLFGIGISNYPLLYTAVKPLSLNATRFWDALPTTASSEILTLLPTLGLLGTLTLLYFVFRLVLTSRRTTLFLPTLILALALLLVPASLPLYTLLFISYSLTQNTDSRDLSLNRFALPFTTFVLALSGLALLFSPLRTTLSEFFIRRAQLALASGESQLVYDYHLRALQTNPQITNYHLSFSDINLRLASALSQKSDLTESDRETIARLVQQSIESGKRGITLRPNDSRAWLALAKTYQNLINVAEGSENFALEAYNRAIYLDRANPTLRLEYAGLLSQLAAQQSVATTSATYRSRAINEAQTAIQLKSDYANAYYNLAKLYEAAGDKAKAVAALEAILRFLDQNSSEYTQVKNELANLSSAPTTSPTPSPAPTQNPTLTTPSPLPEPLDGGPIDLSTD